MSEERGNKIEKQELSPNSILPRKSSKRPRAKKEAKALLLLLHVYELEIENRTCTHANSSTSIAYRDSKHLEANRRKLGGEREREREREREAERHDADSMWCLRRGSQTLKCDSTVDKSTAAMRQAV
jgi:hypothetical protein